LHSFHIRTHIFKKKPADFEFAKKFALSLASPSERQFTPTLAAKEVDRSAEERQSNIRNSVGELDKDKQFIAVNAIVNDSSLNLASKLDRLSKLNLAPADFEFAKKFAISTSKTSQPQFTPTLTAKEVDRSAEERQSNIRNSVGELDKDKQFIAVNAVVNNDKLNLAQKLDRLSQMGLDEKDFENAKRFSLAMSRNSTGGGNASTPSLTTAARTSVPVLNADGTTQNVEWGVVKKKSMIETQSNPMKSISVTPVATPAVVSPFQGPLLEAFGSASFFSSQICDTMVVADMLKNRSVPASVLSSFVGKSTPAFISVINPFGGSASNDFLKVKLFEAVTSQVIFWSGGKGGGGQKQKLFHMSSHLIVCICLNLSLVFSVN
jgi:hypothetical protein